jgi:molecular chaperone GrpE
MATKNQSESDMADAERETDGNANDQAFVDTATGNDQLTNDLAAANDRVLRLQAEMQNLRSRTSREIADERKYAAMPVLRDLLPVLDNIGRAIEAAEKAGEAENLLAGFRLVKQQLETILSRHEAEPIVPVRELFDPHFHQAILHQPSADVPANHVTMVTQTGYKLHDRVVRPAQVVVSSGPQA